MMIDDDGAVYVSASRRFASCISDLYNHNTHVAGDNGIGLA
jgi:hypothetical protein